MAASSGIWAIVILGATMMVSMYLFFEVLGFTPAGSTVTLTAAH
jgi:hypothetical protein